MSDWFLNVIVKFPALTASTICDASTKAVGSDEFDDSVTYNETPMLPGKMEGRSMRRVKWKATSNTADMKMGTSSCEVMNRL